MAQQQDNLSNLNEVPPQLAMLQMTAGYWVSQSVYVAAKLGIADLVKDEPKTVVEIAEAVGANSNAVYRLLRALAGVGVFAEVEQGRFSSTPLSACLQSGVPGSIRAWAILLGEEHYRAWGNILHSMKTSEPAFNHVFGMDWFEYCAQNPQAGAIFDETMTSVSVMVSAAIATAYDFSQIDKLVDVGGGYGGLITSILKVNPKMKGILFDLPHVIESAKQKKYIETEKLAERCELISGNFLDSVPNGCDAYILKNAIHDWDDRQAIAILKNCYHAMAENGKLLLVEGVIPPGNEPSFTKLVDLNMLMMTSGGRERTEIEYRDLYTASGFRLTRIVSTQTELSVIEGVRI